jgi:hypothetical protein
LSSNCDAIGFGAVSRVACQCSTASPSVAPPVAMNERIAPSNRNDGPTCALKNFLSNWLLR